MKTEDEIEKIKEVLRKKIIEHGYLGYFLNDQPAGKYPEQEAMYEDMFSEIRVLELEIRFNDYL